MKTLKQNKLAIVLIASALTLGAVGTAMAQGIESKPISEAEVTPYIIDGNNPGGNRTCAEVGHAFYGNALYYQCRSDKLDYPFAEGKSFEDISGNEDCDRNVIDVEVTDGTYVGFTAQPDGIGAAIVKGSADANVYVYNPQSIRDAGLAAPLTASGNPAGLSNLAFCWNPDDELGPPLGFCYEDETAWAYGDRYTPRGNWATYTAYEAGKEVTLYAGQTLEAGLVTFSGPVDGVVTIDIALNDGWRFALVPDGVDEDDNTVYDNNLKVQDYEEAPSGNPEPGLFRWKTFVEGQSGSIEVPLNNFYGVHVDVERQVACPVPDAE
ncbi:MAG: hypothetical protein IBX56_07900 [Methylomicrobium sp.]|nr:hypothetical protein [Methylomicrobium sp.]